eukprot:4989526-Prorocentrum_lima.AAC.1
MLLGLHGLYTQTWKSCACPSSFASLCTCSLSRRYTTTSPAPLRQVWVVDEALADALRLFFSTMRDVRAASPL